MQRSALLVLAAGAVWLAACSAGNDDLETSSTQAPAAPAATAVAPAPTTAAPAAATAGASVAVKTTTSPLGQILVGPDGRTLYAFTNDTEAKSTCTGTCAEAWPPAIVDASWSVAPGLDAGVFSTTARSDGGEQLVAGKFPLYYFSGDASPGDTNGQGSGNVWYVVDLKAQPVLAQAGAAAAAPTTAPAPAAAPAAAANDYGASTPAPAPAAAPAAASGDAAVVTTADSDLGAILVDPEGRTMYAFTKDVDGNPTCNDACANAWPPVIVDGDPIAQGLDQSLFTTVPRADGSIQLKAGKWPMYYFSGDAGPGETNGQGSGGSWFVVGGDAKLIK